MVELGPKVQEGQAKQVSPGEGVEELNMLGLVEFEEEDAERTQADAGEEEEVFHG